MSTRKTLGVLAYLALLAIALVFCWHEVRSYINGNTDYSVSHRPLTMMDLPTLAICLPPAVQIFPVVKNYIYGQNLLIYVSILDSTMDVYLESTLLEEDRSVQAQNKSLKIHLTKIKQKNMAPHQCYKISPIWTGNPKAGLEFDSNFQLQFNFLDSSVNVWDTFKESSGRIYLTSEENSYGLTLGRWFDGKMDSVALKGSQNMIYDVYEVNEYVRMDWHCSHDSYFERLAKRFKEIKFSDISSKINKGYFNTSKCQWEKICTPISLPPVGENYIPQRAELFNGIVT